MRQRIVGSYLLGDEYVELVLREDTGGEFYLTPEDGHIARIKIGAGYLAWPDVVRTLLHEAMELALARIKVRFYPEDDHGGDTHNYLFILSHGDYSDACGRVAVFLVAALPDLSAAWKVWGRAEK